jgi:uncharacterized membrane protein YdcZ (DUF606 family)
MSVLGYGLALAAGISFVFQQAVNANLRADLGSVWWAGFVSYLGGTIAMLVFAVALRQTAGWSSAIAQGRWHGAGVYLARSISLYRYCFYHV